MLAHSIHSSNLRPRVIARRSAICLYSLLALCLWSPNARAQYRFDQWTTENGLPQNSVRGILQARDGYIWMTTFDGLARFDGVRFTLFNKSNSTGMASNRFLQIFEDRFGDIWATLETGGLVRRHQGRFTTYAKGQGLPLDSAPSLGDDGQGNLILSWGRSLFRWSEDRFQPAGEARPSEKQPPDERFDRARPLNCWQDDGKLFCFVNGQTHSWTWRGLPEPHFYATTDDQGNIWICAPQSLIRIRDGGVTQVYTARNGLPGINPLLVSGKRRPLQAISRDAAGSIWLTDLDSMQNRMISRRPPEELDYHSAYADNEGNYWFLTGGGGLFRARKQTVTGYGKTQGLNAKEVYSLLESRDGSIWIGALGDGLFRFKDGAFTNYSSGGILPSFYEDSAGQLWTSGSTRMLEGRPVRELWGESQPNPLLSTNRSMCEDRAGSYWIGLEGGVARYLNGVMTYYTTKDGLAGNDTRVIINDTAGGLWLGSYGGLTRYKDGKFTAWTEKDGLPGNMVRALKQDGDGVLWIGTYDSGLGRLTDGRFTRYTKHDGLFDSGVFQILEDDYGWFWMSCNRGIYRVRKQELNDFADGRVKTITCLAYNKSDGMPSSECNGGTWPAGIKTRDGKLWFPTMGGVAVIDPASIRTNEQPPPVVIEEMRINNQPVALETRETAIRNHPQDWAAIHVEPGQENFEIQYTALSFINSENLRFRYKLEGADHDWVEAGTRRTAYYSHVSPGSYTFKVIAANSDGVWNQTGAGMRITVVPPFWRTWWFLALAALGVAGLVAGAWSYRVAQLRRIQTAQQNFARQLIESQERERKRIAAELHDSLGQNLLIVKNRAQLGQIAAHDAPEFQEQFEGIIASATQSIEEVREIAQNLRPYHLDRLGLTKALEVMIEKIAATTRLRFVSELTPLDDLFSKEDAITLYRIVQESINNIVKHAQASEVRVSVDRLTDSVALTIHDNGRGFAPADAAAKVSGFGLAGMTERASMLGGALQIDSQEGRGTAVTIRLALPVRTRGATL